jgi:hypothetical protein
LHEIATLTTASEKIKDVLQDLDTISLADVLDRLIHAAIQYKQSPPYPYYQNHIP